MAGSCQGLFSRSFRNKYHVIIKGKVEIVYLRASKSLHAILYVSSVDGIGGKDIGSVGIRHDRFRIRLIAIMAYLHMIVDDGADNLLLTLEDDATTGPVFGVDMSHMNVK